MEVTVNQPTINPTNKLTAATIGIAVVEVMRVVVGNLAPEWSDQALWPALSPIIVFACGWFVKDEPNVMVGVKLLC